MKQVWIITNLTTINFVVIYCYIVGLLSVFLCFGIPQPVGSGLDVFEGRLKLSAWRDRVQAEIGKELFDEAHQGILASQEMVKNMDSSKMQVFKPKILRFFLWMLQWQCRVIQIKLVLREIIKLDLLFSHYAPCNITVQHNNKNSYISSMENISC